MTGLITTPRLALLRLFKPCGRQTNMAPIISTSWSSCSCIISLSWFIGLLLVEKVQQKSHDFTFKVGLWLPSCVPSLVLLALEEPAAMACDSPVETAPWVSLEANLLKYVSHVSELGSRGSPRWAWRWLQLPLRSWLQPHERPNQNYLVNCSWILEPQKLSDNKSLLFKAATSGVICCPVIDL